MTTKHVGADYRHYRKRISPGEVILFGSSRLKWYDLARDETPVEAGVRVLALRFLFRAAEEPDWPLDEDVGFAILHRCGHEFYFLILCSWRGENELWETVYFKPDASTPDFALFPQGAHKGTFCVWEAGAVKHEVAAWSRFLMSPRDEAALKAYLHDLAEGVVE